MNALQMARTAYSNTAAPIRTPRGTEYEAFARITHRLRQTAQDKKRSYSAYVKALYDNRRLWTLLASNVAESDNQLPKELRAQIFYLAQFTAKHTSDILARKADEMPLIDINTAIMRGLQREGQ
ncbi:flagellar biosynthesis regulator FlaF [Celeribacter persicus]|uniref:Flagellar protein FlaF n=1 Tax=Celeribacter persicus TaxID=1651082 RepID=A0A2T5HU50_9RHOB|nr:flagellar biosynthesis regulator FlaF [Celeribacter persicus]PTQ75018.1 flagellar protein FlaF [Celeribacter persicus]